MTDSPPNPKASRPHLPGYGLLEAESGSGLLPWAWATERLTRSHNYYLATTRPDHRPHVMPIWGMWAENAFYFSTGRQSRKAQNLATNAHCVISTELLQEAVIVEGLAEEVNPRSLAVEIAEAYFAKYGWKLDPEMGPIFRVQPIVVFGFDESDFTGGSTKWTFDRN
ncbi:MAG: pyridoxamine 5'-phosphate oxidase family protein [Acidobacteria bacterium]|nr:pyridoxamine 5'-phosphate oxidase family protein [Acidobacteriota bacterium]